MVFHVTLNWHTVWSFANLKKGINFNKRILQGSFLFTACFPITIYLCTSPKPNRLFDQMFNLFHSCRKMFWCLFTECRCTLSNYRIAQAACCIQNMQQILPYFRRRKLYILPREMLADISYFHLRCTWPTCWVHKCTH